MLHMRLATVRMAGGRARQSSRATASGFLDYPMSARSCVPAIRHSRDRAVAAFGEGEYERLSVSLESTVHRSQLPLSRAEMGVAPPHIPAYGAKFTRSLIGARDAIRLPRSSEQCDFEVELTIVIGARHVCQ